MQDAHQTLPRICFSFLSLKFKNAEASDMIKQYPFLRMRLAIGRPIMLLGVIRPKSMRYTSQDRSAAQLDDKWPTGIISIGMPIFSLAIQ